MNTRTVKYAIAAVLLVTFIVTSLVTSQPANNLPADVPTMGSASPQPQATQPAPYIPRSEPARAGPPSQPVPQQVVIQFAPQTTDAERTEYIESIGGTVTESIDSLDTVVVNISEETAQEPLPESPVVTVSEPDYYVSALDDLAPINDPRYLEQWALPAIGAPSAWAQLPADAPKVTVAVIDSGICADHPDLAGRILDGWDFLESDATPQDDFGHGCSVSGVIAANMNDGIGIAGVAPNAQIMPLRVLNASGVGSYSDVAAAIVYAADNGAQVINLSLGGSNPSFTLENAVNYAISKGVIIVAAAGNSGTEGALYPAAYPDVIAVGSVDPNLQHSSFSNYGSQIDIWGPGRDILTTKRDGGYGLVSGTSFSTPYLAGSEAVNIALSRELSQNGEIVWLGEQQVAVIDTPLVTGTLTAEPEGGSVSTTDNVSAQISVGSCAVVTNSGAGLAVRSSPGTTSTLIKRIGDGTVVQITGGPTSASGLTWWQHNQGGWSAESQNGVRYLTDTSCSGGGGSSGKLVLIQDLSLSTTSPVVNQNISASFRVKNTGGQAITIQNLGVQGRLNGDVNSTNRDFNWVQNITLQPNEEYAYSSNRSIDITGNWTLRPNFQMNGAWSDVHRADNSVNTVWITVQNAPPPPPAGNLVLIQDLSLSTTSPTVNQSISASYRVKNTGGQAITIQNLGVQGRLNGDVNSTNRDFNWVQNITLQPNEEYAYSSNRSIDITGSWTLRPNYQMNGQWSDVKHANGTVNTVWITVQNAPPPVGNLVLIQDLSLSTTSPIVNQSFSASFRVKNTGGQAVTIQNLGVQGRLNGDVNSTNRDFNWVQNITLQPNEEYAYSSSRSIDITGSWTLRPNFQMNGVWNDVHRADNSVNTVWITVQNVPPPPAGNIQIYTALQLSPTNPTPGQSVNAQVTIKNNGGTTFTAPFFGVKGRYTSDDSDYSYGWIQNFSLAPGATYTFNGNRAFDRTGNYWFTANYQDGSGNWNDVKWTNGSTNYVNLTVGNVVVNPGCFTLSISSPNGSVARDKTGNCNSGNGYLGGTVLRLTATPNSGYAFTGWSGVATGITNPIFVTVTGNTSITANFVQSAANCYSLNLTYTNGQITPQITSGASCTGGYTAGSTISLTAAPNNGYSFSNWSGDANGSSITATVFMNSSKNVTANFTSNAQVSKQVVVLVHGWHGFDGLLSPITCSGGLMKFVDNNSTSNDFGMFAQQLKNDNFDVYIAHLDTSPAGTPIIEHNAECLKQELSTLPQGTKVSLIAHSMGGLVSRAYIESPVRGYYMNNVTQLITLGTPHVGTSFGMYPCLGIKFPYLIDMSPQDAACQFSTIGIDYFNQTYSSRTPNVKYVFIGGDLTPLGLGTFLLPFDGPNDGAVGVNSAMGKKYSLLSPPTVVVNANNTFSVSAGHTGRTGWWPSYVQKASNDMSATDSYSCVLHFLDPARNINCNQLTASNESQSQSILVMSQTPTLLGHLSTGQVVTRNISIDTTSESQIRIAWKSGIVSLTLTNPLGIVINPTYAASHPSEVTYTENLADPASQYFANYTFATTVSGIYTLNITAGNVGTGGTDYSALALVDSTRILNVTTDKTLYSIGSTANITASLQKSGTGLTGATLQAILYRRDGTTDIVQLLHQGSGIYTGTYAIPNAQGYIGLSVIAQGSDNGISYSRQVDSLLSVVSQNVTLAGQYSDGINDLNGDGLYDNLNVAVGISASLAQGAEAGANSVGNYVFSADLVDGNGNLVAHTNAETTLSPGQSNVVLPFNGDDIRSSGASGPYKLTNLTIIDQQTSAPAVWQAQDTWTTGAYSPQDFSTSCFVLNVNVSGSGTVAANPQPNCNNGLQYAAGTAVTLTAQNSGGDPFTHWAGDIEDSSATVTVTVNQDLDTTANFNPSNSVFVLKTFTVASTQSASLDANAKLPIMSNPTDLEAATIHGFYNAGDMVNMIVRTQNTTGADAIATFQWWVTDPMGRTIDATGWDGDLTTSNGVVDWSLTRTLPANLITGTYTFTGTITYNGYTSFQSSAFYVNGPAGPSNDSFTAPVTIGSVPYSGSIDTWGATVAATDPTPTCGNGKNSNSVWYKYTAPANGLLEVDTWGSDYDTVAAVWTGSISNLTLIQCNDDAYNYLQSWLQEVPVAAGTTYYIEVMDYGVPGGGNLQLYVDFAPVVANDDFNAPTIVSSNPYSMTQNTHGATKANDDPSLTTCNRLPGQASVWHRYIAPVDGELQLDTKGSDYDTMLAVWTGSRGILASIGCNDDIGNVNGTWDSDSILTVPVTAGTTYYIEVSTFNGYIDINGASATEMQDKQNIVVSEEALASSLQDKKTELDKNGGLITDLQSKRPDEVSSQFWGGQLQLHTDFESKYYTNISRWTTSFDLSHGWTVADFVRTVGDVNGDGKADLVGFGLDGVYVALSNGTGFEPAASKWTSSFDLSHGWTVADYVRTVGDVNNDGKADLVGFGQDGVYVALSTGSGFGAVSRWTTAFDLSHGWTVADFVRTVGDVNNDGNADLIGFGQDGVYVALSNGTGFGSVSKWTSSFDLSHGWTVRDFVRTVGDVNNDGRDDLVGFGLDGVYVALSNGTGFDAVSKWSSSFDLSHGWTVASFVRTVADVNNDGRVDLVGFGLNGVYVALSTGSGFGTVNQYTASFDQSHGWTVSQFVRILGDVNVDGKADLIGFGLDGVYISVAK